MTTPDHEQNTFDDDPFAERRKHDHIALAFKSRVDAGSLDPRFYYEPLLAGHPAPGSLPAISFLGKTLRAPMWVSSMTGGTALARIINHNLARACEEFGLGMGLGSCRQLLFSDEFLADFDVRDTMGNSVPLFANLGIAQLEQLFDQQAEARIQDLIDKLRADGLIVHVNPLQEAMQPEGDVIKRPPVETIQQLIELFEFPIIVKEVGQGFGPASLKALLKLPLGAVEFAAAGGTNFAKLELLRNKKEQQDTYGGLTTVGHAAFEMLQWSNWAHAELGHSCKTQHLIISGGISDFLDGYYLTQKSAIPAVYGQASAYLQHAQADYESLRDFVQSQITGLELARAFLVVR
ncbi:MAG: type 2 isopentenyl-diphosphate Delta-isomerase [Saprospiraceae bacterium]|nr:type 2 isopentenyl-diphosphate Delta-isomerase [Saprospiraceae bacterium]